MLNFPARPTQHWSPILESIGSCHQPSPSKPCCTNSTSGLADKPKQVQGVRLQLNRSGEKTAVIYDKGFPIKEEVFSERIGGGERTLP